MVCEGVVKRKQRSEHGVRACACMCVHGWMSLCSMCVCVRACVRVFVSVRVVLACMLSEFSCMSAHSCSHASHEHMGEVLPLSALACIATDRGSESLTPLRAVACNMHSAHCIQLADHAQSLPRMPRPLPPHMQHPQPLLV